MDKVCQLRKLAVHCTTSSVRFVSCNHGCAIDKFRDRWNWLKLQKIGADLVQRLWHIELNVLRCDICSPLLRSVCNIDTFRKWRFWFFDKNDSSHTWTCDDRSNEFIAMNTTKSNQRVLGTFGINGRKCQNDVSINHFKVKFWRFI